MKYLLYCTFLSVILLLTACTSRQQTPTITPDIPTQEIPQKPTEKPTKDTPIEKPIEKESTKEVIVKPKPPRHIVSTLPLIGEAEYVYIDALQKRFKARIDTGATTSSLNAQNIQYFERDSKEWIRFTIPLSNGTNSVIIERPIKRHVSIKGDAKNKRRPVIDLYIHMGVLRGKTEFTLADRSEYEFPILIGRSFLRGAAVVDVSQKYITSPIKNR